MCDHQTPWVTIPIGNVMRRNYKVAMSLKELIRETNDFSQKDKEGQPRTAGCTAALLESNPKEMYLRYNVKCTLSGSDKAGHDVKVRFDYWNINEKTNIDNLDMECSCSCPAFLYWGAQWNLHKKDTLEGDARPELVAPTERLDLRGKYLICKHIKVVLDRIIPSVSRVINDVKRKNQVDAYKLREEVEERQRRNKTRPGEGGIDVAPKKKRSPVKDIKLPPEEQEEEPIKKGPSRPGTEDKPEPKPKVKSYPGIPKKKEEPVVEPEPVVDDLPEEEEEKPITRNKKIKPSRSGVIR